MAIIASTGGTVNGTEDDDIIVNFASDLDPTPDVLNGNGGRDVIFGDFGPFTGNPIGNDSFTNATNIDSSGIWSTSANPDVGDPSIPHTTIIDNGEGQFAYYAVTVGAGETITIDLDYGKRFDGDFDGEIRLFDANEIEVDTNDDIDDADVPLEGLGSEDGTSSLDPYLTYTNDTGSSQTYYIRVEQFDDSPIAAGGTYMLNVSVTGHPATFVPIEDNDTINGGDDNDVIYGMGGDDTLNGDAGDDLIVGGTGADMINGGANDAGGDTASYANSSEGVNINLSNAGAQSGGDAAGDVLTGIENLTGSAHGDTLFGSVGVNNILRGGDGNDALAGFSGVNQLFGGAGNDGFGINNVPLPGAGSLFDGGTGNDRIDALSFSGVTLDLRPYTIVSVETLQVGSRSIGQQGDFQINASQFIPNFTTVTDVSVGNLNAVLSIFMDTVTSLDLSNVTFNSFNGANDRVTIEGDTDAENIIGSSVNDTINGDDGDDTIEGGLGDDILNGGAGTMDRLSYANFQSLDGETGITFNPGGNSSGTVNTGGAGMDTFSGFEILEGSGFNDTLGGLFDIIDGGDGDDTLLFLSGGGIPEFIGGEGIDTLDFSDPALGTNDHFIDLNNGYFSFEFDFPGSYDAAISGIENYNGSGGRDNVIGTAGVNVLNGNNGDDTLEGGLGADILNGGADTDTASYANSAAGVTVFTNGSAGRGGDAQGDKLDSIENIIGSDQQDNIVLNADTAVDNTVNAGDGADRIRSRDGGTDNLFGEDGDDNIFAGNSDGVFDGGNGSDNIFGGAGDSTFFGGGDDDGRDAMFGGGGADVMFGGGGKDALRGNTGNDTLNGGEGDDTLEGGNQVDILNGDGGNDRLDGGSGNDTLNGGTGNDRMTGGASNDLFIFETGGGTDRITDFNESNGDRIDISDFMLADYAAVEALMSQSGTDVRINFATGETLILLDTTLGSLGSSDFIMV